MKKIFFIFIFLVFCPFSAQATSTNVASSPVVSSSVSEPQQMLDFNIVGYGAKGEKTWDVQGAQMDMQGNEVKINDITAHLYGAEEDMVLTADHGLFDKDSGMIYLTDNVRAVTDNGAELTTKSLDWSQKKQLITTNDKVNITKGNITAVATGVSAQPDIKVATFEKDVVLTLEEQKKAEEGKSKGMPMPGPGRMVITCDGPMTLNYEKHIAIFEKNVKVEGDADQGTMVADKMTVYFNTTAKSMEKIEAEGNVTITRGENTSFSDGAIFTAADRKMTLTGRPKLIFFAQEGTHASP
jgi:LPS export ABC transporter protein LptC